MLAVDCTHFTFRPGRITGDQDFTLQVSEPDRDPWVGRVANPEEKPEDNQLYPRDDQNRGPWWTMGLRMKSMAR